MSSHLKRGSKTVFLRASDVFGQNIAHETDVLPLEKGAGGIFPNDPGIRHDNSMAVPRIKTLCLGCYILP